MTLHPTVRKTALVGLGILAGLVFISISVNRMDWRLVYRELAAVKLYPWFFIGIAIYICGHFVRGYRTKMLVSRDASLALITSSSIVIAGYAANNIIPARVGELARAGMLSERTGIPLAQSLAVVFIERILDGMTILILCALAVFMTGSGMHSLATLLPFVVCTGLTCIFLATIAPHRVIAFVSKTAHILTPARHDTILRQAAAAVNGTAWLKEPKNVLLISVASLLIWLCDTGLFLSILNVFSISITLWNVLLIMTVANLGVFLITSPGYASPGHIGPFHTLVMQGLVLLGCGQATAFAYAITLHCAIYIPIMCWGAAVMLWYGVTLGLKFSLARKARLLTGPRGDMPQTKLLGKTPACAVDEKATPFIYKLTESVLPLNQYDLPHPKEVIAYCADFTQGELRNLSAKIRLLFSIGMLGFNVLVWLRYLRPFIRLPLPCRTRIFSWWAYGKIPVTRQLFKLIRSTVLLAFFEHPAIVHCMENNKKKP